MKRTLLVLFAVWACGAASADVPPSDTVATLTDLPIMGASRTSRERFVEHVSVKNPGIDRYYARRVFETYQTECLNEGVDVVVALSQMIHETDYLLFTGSVSSSQYNFAGIGATAPGEKGLSFPNLAVGVRAHVQHLKAYGSSDPLQADLVDPRFGYVTRGSAVSVNELAGRWATDPGYGPKVMAHVNRLIIP